MLGVNSLLGGLALNLGYFDFYQTLSRAYIYIVILVKMVTRGSLLAAQNQINFGGQLTLHVLIQRSCL